MLITIWSYFKDQGMLEEAIEAYSKALSLKPDHTETLGNTSYLKGQISDTIIINQELRKKLKLIVLN